jgi:hypothetical protein
MARPRTPIGTFGQISFASETTTTVTAHTRFRDYDGRLRPVQATGSTRKQAEHNLKAVLARRSRIASGSTDLSGDTLLSLSWSALALAKMTGEVHPHLLRSTAATYVARRMNSADAAALLGHKIDAGVTGEHYIERLRLAPDTSAVLQEMVDIGKEEARAPVARADQVDRSVAAEGVDRCAMSWQCSL